MFDFKERTSAKSILWETCAPGHGKGPWDGVGAVIKRLLRMLEKDEKVYAQGPFCAFKALHAEMENWKKSIGSKAKLDNFVIYYVPVVGEECDKSFERVLSPVTRPKARPQVTAVPGIRSNFCFDFTA